MFRHEVEHRTTSGGSSAGRGQGNQILSACSQLSERDPDRTSRPVLRLCLCRVTDLCDSRLVASYVRGIRPCDTGCRLPDSRHVDAFRGGTRTDVVSDRSG